MALNTIWRPKKPLLLMALLIALANLMQFAAVNSYAETVALDVAKIAAAENLPLFYPGRWDYFTHFILYDLDNERAAYAIVFSKAGSEISSIKDLEAHMAATRTRIAFLSSSIEQVAIETGKSGKEKNRLISDLRRQMNSARSDLIGKDRFATVYTGAQDTWPVVLKCHKGLPVHFVNKSEAIELIREEHPYAEWEIAKFLYLGTFDEAFRFRPVTPEGEVVDKESTTEFLVVDIRTRQIASMGELRDKQGELKRERRQMIQGDSTLYDEAEKRKDTNRKRWNRYRSRMSTDKSPDSKPDLTTNNLNNREGISDEKAAPLHGVKEAVEGVIDSKNQEKKVSMKQKAPLQGTKRAVQP